MDDFFEKSAIKNTMVMPEKRIIKSVYCPIFLSANFLNLSYVQKGYFMNNLPNFVYTFKKDNDVVRLWKGSYYEAVFQSK